MTWDIAIWVLGGEYRDCRFDEVVPGTEEISGPFSDMGAGADRMDPPDLPRPARGDSPLRDHAGSRAQ